jgi:hypothetical protein
MRRKKKKKKKTTTVQMIISRKVTGTVSRERWWKTGFVALTIAGGNQLKMAQAYTVHIAI